MLSASFFVAGGSHDRRPFILFLFGVADFAAAVADLRPTDIANTRNDRNLTAIWALNLFGGWTIVGWVIPPRLEPHR